MCFYRLLGASPKHCVPMSSEMNGSVTAVLFVLINTFGHVTGGNGSG